MRHPNVWAWAGIDQSKICLYPHTLVKIQNINYQVVYTGASFLTKCMHQKGTKKSHAIYLMQIRTKIFNLRLWSYKFTDTELKSYLILNIDRVVHHHIYHSAEVNNRMF